MNNIYNWEKFNEKLTMSYKPSSTTGSQKFKKQFSPNEPGAGFKYNSLGREDIKKMDYYNGLFKKFKDGSITETEKKDYFKLIEAKISWIKDSENDEYIKKLNEFESKLTNIDYISHKPGKKDILEKKIFPTDPERINVGFKKSDSKHRSSNQTNKEDNLKKLVIEYNEWLHKIEIPFSELSKYISYDYKGKVEKFNLLNFLLLTNDDIEKDLEGEISDKDFLDAKSKYNRERTEIIEELAQIETNLYGTTRFKTGEEKSPAYAIKNNENVVFEFTGSYIPTWLFDPKYIPSNYKIVMAYSLVTLTNLKQRNKMMVN